MGRSGKPSLLRRRVFPDTPWCGRFETAFLSAPVHAGGTSVFQGFYASPVNPTWEVSSSGPGIKVAFWGCSLLNDAPAGCSGGGEIDGATRDVRGAVSAAGGHRRPW